MAENSVIVIHDSFAIKGGGERSTLTIVEHLADALCYGFATIDGFDPAEFTSKKLYDLQAAGRFPGQRFLKFFFAFRHGAKLLRNYDTVVYTGIMSVTAIRHHPHGRNIFYCFTPPRFVYDGYDFHMVRLSTLKRLFMRAYIPVLRRLYEAAVRRMDCVIADSVTVQKRLATYLDVPSVVVYPPCNVNRFIWRGQGDYYLSTARVEPLKRVELVVKAFIQAPDKKLVVVSGGSELERLQRLAADSPNITFTGWVDEEKLLELMGNCIATLYMPINEDFGMSPVESMSAGKPVIGVQEGGVMETVVDGETGFLTPTDPQVEDVVEAVRQLTPERALAMRDACRKRSLLFSEEAFVEAMRAVIAGECNASFPETG